MIRAIFENDVDESVAPTIVESPMPRTRSTLHKAQVGNDTRNQLIDAAERLFAEQGIEAVSMRSIGVAAQQANKFAVQYHFTDKRSLVAAIFERRAPAVEDSVSELTEMLVGSNSRPELGILVSVLFLPIVRCGNDKPNIYARFLLNLLCSQSYWSVSNVSLARLMFGLEPEGQSATTHIVKLIDKALPHIPRAVLRQRLCSVTRMLLCAVINRENAQAAGYPVWPLDTLISDQLAMMAGALSQPFHDPLSRIVDPAPLESTRSCRPCT